MPILVPKSQKPMANSEGEISNLAIKNKIAWLFITIIIGDGYHNGHCRISLGMVHDEILGK